MAVKIDSLEKKSEEYKELSKKVDNLSEGFYELKGSVEAHFETYDANYAKIDAKFDKIDARFDKLETKVDNMENTINGYGPTFSALKKYLADKNYL
jgi:predicted  nucleic acid-binding Zn-ribbon protein